MDDNRTDAEKANDEALALQAKATEAQIKADAPDVSPEQKKADDLAAKADDARARANELSNQDGVDGSTVTDAKVLVPAGTDPNMPAGYYEAAKRGNDPANPKYAPGVSRDENDQTVKLSRVTADSPTPVCTWVHPDMVGDYIRAGWGRAD